MKELLSLEFDVNNLREKFEKTSVKYSLHSDIYFDEKSNQYQTKNDLLKSMVIWVNGAWSMFQELNK